MTIQRKPSNVARDIVRQAWPKVKPRASRRGDSRQVIAGIRRAEMTVAEGARQLGCDVAGLGKRVWLDAKEDAIRRDKCCIRCGAVPGLDVHHRRARMAGGTSDPVIAFGLANLVTLCRTHHDYFEQHPDEARELKLRLGPDEVPAETPVRYFGRWVLLADDGSIQPSNQGSAE